MISEPHKFNTRLFWGCQERKSRHWKAIDRAVMVTCIFLPTILCREWLARIIHYCARFISVPFRPLRCGAILWNKIRLLNLYSYITIQAVQAQFHGWAKAWLIIANETYNPLLANAKCLAWSRCVATMVTVKFFLISSNVKGFFLFD